MHTNDSFTCERRIWRFPVPLLNNQLDGLRVPLLLSIFAVADADQALTILGQRLSGSPLARFEHLASPHKLTKDELRGGQLRPAGVIQLNVGKAGRARASRRPGACSALGRADSCCPAHTRKLAEFNGAAMNPDLQPKSKLLDEVRTMVRLRDRSIHTEYPTVHRIEPSIYPGTLRRNSSNRTVILIGVGILRALFKLAAVRAVRDNTNTSGLKSSSLQPEGR